MSRDDAGTRVLIADRLEMFRRGIVQVLHEAWPQWSCCSTAGIGELKALMAGERRDLLLLDLNLPGLGDVVGIQQIRALHPDCAILMVGDSEDRSVILECLSAGALGYVLRTTNPAQLLRAVETILSGAVFAPACLAGRPSLVPAVAPEMIAEEPKPGFPHFTGRQNDVFRLLAEGCATKTIARRLNLAVGTVKVHLAAIYRQLGVHGRLEALARGRDFDIREAKFGGFPVHDTRSIEVHELAA